MARSSSKQITKLTQSLAGSLSYMPPMDQQGVITAKLRRDRRRRKMVGVKRSREVARRYARRVASMLAV